VAESGRARWSATAPSDLTPELCTVRESAPSSLDPSDLIDAVTGYLRDADPAWDPYAVPP
jgi:hypothetical protein